MFIAMNRFKVVKGYEDEFVEIWKNRDRRLKELDGFVSFAMLRGAEHDEYTLFASHTTWESEAHFTAWTESEQFRTAHKKAEQHSVKYMGPPKFEGFTVILEEN
ncbi:MAG: antibiotic biosynthesis monooxygenase [Rhodobacterales bacterium]|nr:MAG: antibiotic biosynthesis monooxygenase [Rhodobacterales bacterium]